MPETPQAPRTQRDRRDRVVTSAIALFLVAPLLLLVPRALADVWRAPALAPQAWGLRGVREAFRPGQQILEALGNSLSVAIAVTIVAVLLAWPAARTLARLHGSTRALVFVALVAPLLVPAYATGIGLTPLLLRLGVADHLLGIVLAHLLYVLPYVTLALLPAMGADLDAMQEAARVSGASRLQSWWHVALPTARGTVATAMLLGFLVSWAQVGTSLAVGGGLPMLPVAALPFVRSDPQIAATMNLVLLAAPLAALAVTVRLRRLR
ncbi:MAG: putative spermidine/putrescine transport system permease protein [Glaciecola sp.]|jgi:putative spermidine/putrescine transport system permease protein